MNRPRVPASGEAPSPAWGIAQIVHFSDVLRMRGVASGAAIALGLAASLAGGFASAENLNVSMSSKTPDLGNVLITTSTAQAKVTAASGAVSFPSGTAFRVRKNGLPPSNMTPNIVTITCTNSPGNCGHTYKVFISAVLPTVGKATGVPLVNVGPITCASSNVTCSITGPAENAPSDTVQFFTITSNNQQGFTVTFAVGASVNLNAATTANSGAAQWQYKVRIQ